MGKWTKGPWTVDGAPDNQIVWSGPDERVCFLAHSDGRDEDRDIATGRLIAAAPDLAAAVRRQVENIERWRETGIPASPEESKSIYEQLLAALTRATGG